MADRSKFRTFANFLGNVFEAMSHTHTIADMAGSLKGAFFGKKGAENDGPDDRAQGRHGWRGFGDERQQWQFFFNIPDFERWLGFVDWHYRGDTWLRQREARAKREELRVFLTEWDRQAVEVGTSERTRERRLKTITEIVKETSKLYDDPPQNAQRFIALMIQIMGEEENRLLQAVQDRARHAQSTRRLPLDFEITNELKQRCREGGYLKVLRLFELTGVPMIPQEPGWIDAAEATYANWTEQEPFRDRVESTIAFVKQAADERERTEGRFDRMLRRFLKF